MPASYPHSGSGLEARRDYMSVSLAPQALPASAHNSKTNRELSLKILISSTT